MTPEILTIGGTYFNFEEPEKSAIEIEDIAHALSHLCRFNGHCRQFYSVAQHSYLTSRLVPMQHAMHALLHDAAEAYVGDITSPLKQLLPGFKDIERRVERAIFAKFGLSAEVPICVKNADLVMLATEERDIMPPHPTFSTTRHTQPLDKTIEPWSPDKAAMVFLEFFKQLDYWRLCGG